MNLNPKISVIIPVYNAEKTLRRCLDSIIVQTFREFEVVLVDDGSNDNSASICDEYNTKDTRFRVIHKSNGGVASARQTGIDNARGVYSIHCDADDYVEPDWLKSLYKQAKKTNADMTICDFFWETKTECKVIHCKPKSSFSHDVLIQVLRLEMFAATYNKLIRHNLYRKFDIRFQPKMCYSEDMYVICDMLSHDINVSYVDKPLYHYTHDNPLSLTVKKTKKHVESNIFLINHIENSPYFDDNVRKELFTIKLWTKELMYYQAGYTAHDVLYAYKEINTPFCELYRKGKYPGDRTLYFLLSGHFLVAYCIKFVGKLKSYFDHIKFI